MLHRSLGKQDILGKITNEKRARFSVFSLAIFTFLLRKNFFYLTYYLYYKDNYLYDENTKKINYQAQFITFHTHIAHNIEDNKEFYLLYIAKTSG